jgi:O-antigen/teichoic acid export membrane protein
MVNIATILKHNMMGKLLNHLLVFGINIFIVRLLGASDSGAYFNELYLVNFVVFIFSGGLDYASIALLSYEPALLRSIQKMLLAVLVFFVIILCIYALLVLPHFNAYFQQPAIAIILFGTGNLMLIFYQGILSAQKKFNLQNAVLSATNMIFLGYLVVCYQQEMAVTMRQVSIAYAALFLIQGLILYGLSQQKAGEVTATVSWPAFIRPGIYIMISSLVYFAFLRIDNFFVEKYTDPVTLGNYVQCGKTGQYFLYFSSMISSTLLPFIASEKIGSSYSEWKKLMTPYIFLITLAALSIAVFGKFIFPILFGDEFKEMHSIMLILLPGFVCLGILTLLNAVYIGKGNIKRIFIGDLVGLCIVTVLDTWLIPEYGVYAAATISSVAYVAVFLYLLAGFKKQFSLPARTNEINYF